MADIILPKMGDAMEEGRIVQWLKNVGDAVKAGEAIAELETDKSNVEIESDADGFLTAINVQAGDMVPVGTVIGVVGAEAGAATAAPAAAPTKPSEPAPAVSPTATDTPPIEEEAATTSSAPRSGEA
jgi:pyruvate/2-oxoglutarate dehydrogenase complex dihydrolipoamide acyltransferase (E2) component